MQGYSTPKKMKRVGELFDKYKNQLKPPQKTVEKACVEVINKTTKYKISVEQVSYTVPTKTIYLNIPSLLKSEIKFKHKEILRKLKQDLGEGNAPENII